MSGAQVNPGPQPAGAGELDWTLDQNEGQQARAQERSSGSAGARLELLGYEVQRSLGRGAYGEVWLAVQENTGREVAVKVFRRHRGLDWPLLKREVGKLVQVLSERRIVHLLAVGWDADPPYYIMEYVRGGSLADRLGDRPMPAEEAIPLFREVAEALVYLHSKAILHCDLKPSNVLLDDRGQVRLADFGQARLSDEEGPAAGTLFYMAPELADPQARPDVRSDLYSLGALLYTMLTGRPPYADEGSTRDLASTGTVSDRLQRYRDIVAASPPIDHQLLPGVDRSLAAIVDRCLRRNPAERYANVQQVLDSLKQRERQRAQRPLIAFGIVGPALLLAALGGLGAWTWSATHDKADATITDQALTSNQELAKMIATAVDFRLEAIKHQVEREAADRDLAGLLTAAAAAPQKARQEERARRFQVHTDALGQQYDHSLLFSWFVAGRDGYMWARTPFDATVVGRFLSHRQWFNGERNYPQAIPQRLPRGASGWTEVFSSQAKNNPAVFSAASPVRSASGAVIGVLGASIRLDQFNEWLRVSEGASSRDGCPNRLVAVINPSGQLIRHPCLRAGVELPLPKEAFLGRREVARLLGATKPTIYRDPLRPGVVYFAAASSLGSPENRGWRIIVEQDAETARQPVHELTDQFDRLGWSALAVGIAVVLALWLVLFRVIRAASGGSGAGARPAPMGGRA